VNFEADPGLLDRASREPRRSREQPADVGGALANCSKQFQLWDVDREVFEPAFPRLEPLERPRPLDALGEGFGFTAVAADCTREVARFVPGSALAGKGYAAFRALRKIALRRPYKTAADDPPS
jgi:hypothetical protein